MREKAAPAPADGPLALARAPRLAPRGATGRWAALLQQIFDVYPLACPTCHRAIRIVAFTPQARRSTRSSRTSVPVPPVNRAPDHGAPLRRGPQRAGARHAPSARPPTPRSPHRYAPRRPATSRGSTACAAATTARPMGPRLPQTPEGDRRSHDAQGARARRRARSRQSRGAGEVGDRAVTSTNSRLTPSENFYPECMPARRTAVDSSKGAQNAPKATPLTEQELKAAEEGLRALVLDGRFDDLDEPFVSHGSALATLRSAREAVPALTEWLAAKAVTYGSIRWPSRQGFRSATDYYIRQAILRELRANRPSAFAEVLWPFKLQYMKLPRALIHEIRVDPSPRDEKLTLYAHMVLSAVWACVENYSIFASDFSALDRCARSLAALSLHVDSVESTLRGAQRAGDVREPLLVGVKARLYMERGRIARAQGREEMKRSEVFLREAVSLYEQRVTARYMGERSEGSKVPTNNQELSDLRFSSSRTAAALLQLAYTNFLESRLVAASTQLKTALLLALSTKDQVLNREIVLVDLAVRRLSLSARRTDNYFAERLALKMSLEKWLEGHSGAVDWVYECMARLQLALLNAMPAHGGFPDIEEALEEVSEIEDLAKAHTPNKEMPLAFSRSVYWTTAAQLVRARISLQYAAQSSGRARSDLCRDAHRSIEDVTQALNDHPELESMKADQQLLSIRAQLLEGTTNRVLDVLNTINVKADTAGYTTLSNPRLLRRLLEVEYNLARQDYVRAKANLTTVHETLLRRNQVGWLFDYYDDLRDRTSDALLLDVSERDCAQFFHEVDVTPPGSKPPTYLMWPELEKRLKEKYYSVVAKHRGSSDKDLRRYFKNATDFTALRKAVGDARKRGNQGKKSSKKA